MFGRILHQHTHASKSAKLITTSIRTKFDIREFNPTTYLQKLSEKRAKRKADLEAARSTAPIMETLKATPHQDGADVGPSVMEGKIFYAIDNATLKSYHNKIIAPATTIVVSLAALNISEWNTIGIVLWTTACIASVINIHSSSSIVTRISAIPSPANRAVPDTRSFPRIYSTKNRVNTMFIPDKYVVELYGYPMSDRIRHVFSPRQTVRLVDESFFPRYVSEEELNLSTTKDKKGYARIAVDVPTIVQPVMYLDQIRDLDLFNQFLAYTTTNNAPISGSTSTATISTTTTPNNTMTTPTNVTHDQIRRRTDSTISEAQALLAKNKKK